MRLRTKIFSLLLVLLLWALCYGVYYLLCTPTGSQFLVRKILEHYTLDRQVQFESVEGDLIHGITFNNLVLKDLDELPKDSQFLVQNFSIRIESFHRTGITAEIVNGRLRLPVSEAVVINGRVDHGRLEGTVFSRALDVSEIIGYLPKNPHTRHLEGLVKELDVDIAGELAMPVVSGSLRIENMDNGQFEVENVPVTFELQRRNRLVTDELFGQVRFESGNVMSKRTVIKLRPSHLYFSGKPGNPRLDINGFSRISKVDITIGIKGDLEKPNVILSSEPSLPDEMLLLMVATGKRWNGLSQSIESGAVSPELAKDFVQYLFFGGRGNFIADKFGLSDFSVSDTTDKQGVGAAKQVTDNLEIKYQVERETNGETEPATTKQTVGSEVRVTNRVTLDLKKEFESGGTEENAGAAEIMLKFKTSF